MQVFYATVTPASCRQWAGKTNSSSSSGGGIGAWGLALHGRSLQCRSSRSVRQSPTAMFDDSSSNGSGRSSAGRQRQRARGSGSGLRREDLPFFIARSDLTWEQPWRFEQTTALADMQLRQQGLSALDDAAAASADQPPVTARFTVQLPSGLGALVVTGTVTADVPLSCEFCGSPYTAGVQEEFDGVIHFEGASATLLAAAEAGDDAELAHNELVFGAEANLCDITPLVSDAIVASLPTVCLCGGATCKQHAGREVVWSSTQQAAPAATASPFAKLLAGKPAKKQRRGGK